MRWALYTVATPMVRGACRCPPRRRAELGEWSRTAAWWEWVTLDERGVIGHVEDDKALVYEAAGSMLVQLQGPLMPEAAAAGPGDEAADAEGDVRVLPVRWRGEKRQRSFAEAVEIMEHHDFGDGELEGEPTCLWFMEKADGSDPGCAVARLGFGERGAGRRPLYL
jgi:hypothetical protein